MNKIDNFFNSKKYNEAQTQLDNEYEAGKILTLKDIPAGCYFKLYSKGKVQNKIFIKKEYDRSEKKYLCISFYDISSYRLLKGTQLVFVGFSF